MKKYVVLLAMSVILACKSKVETINPTVETISESIYASGIIKSLNQYQAFATVNGIVSEIYVKEGDSVKVGTRILSISNETQRLNKENAKLAADYSDIEANRGKLNEAKLQIDLAANKLKVDSAFYFRQKSLYEQQVGTEADMVQRQLVYQNSKTAFVSANVKYNDLKRQLNFASAQSKKNLQISSEMEGDYTLRSEVNGVVYKIMKEKGEIVGLQAPLALIGDAGKFILEMQVDEYDIIKIKKGLLVLVSFDSYKGKVFEAEVSRIDPIMNERSKTFLVESEFRVQPPVLYPNMTFEANIVLQTRKNALLIPRNYIINDSFVIKANDDTALVKTGLKDYQKIEILSGLTTNDELKKPLQ